MAPVVKQQTVVEGRAAVPYESCCASDPAQESVWRIQRALHRRGSFTEIMRRVILFCARQRLYSAAEEEISSYSEFKYVECSQASILDILVQVGALEKKSLDKGGIEIAPARLERLSEDERDDLVASFALKATEAGMAAIADMDPAVRLRNLFLEEPERNEIYLGIMAFCRTSRTFEDVSLLLEDEAPAKSRNPYTDLPLYPSAYLGHLEAAGALRWDDGWLLTEDGSKFLDASIRS